MKRAFFILAGIGLYSAAVDGWTGKPPMIAAACFALILVLIVIRTSELKT